MVATAATVIFNVALVFAATDRIEGRTPTIGGSLAQAWGAQNVIFSWAILSAVVGTAIRMLEQRLGLVGRLIGVAGGLAWAVATFLVIPVLAFEDVGPIEAVKRSSSILKARFGTIARGGLRFGFLFLGLSLGALAVLAIGVVCIAKHASSSGSRWPSSDSSSSSASPCTRGRRDVHAHDPLPLRHGPAHSRPRRRRGRSVRHPAIVDGASAASTVRPSRDPFRGRGNLAALRGGPSRRLAVAGFGRTRGRARGRHEGRAGDPSRAAGRGPGGADH